MRSLSVPAALLVLAASPPSATTPAAIEASIHARGTAAAAAALPDKDFADAVRHAAAGEPAWLTAVAHLRPGTDAGRAEAIDGALSAALQVRPAAVLRLVEADPALPRPAWLCEDRAIEPAAASQRHFVERATAAVTAVRDPALAQARSACLAALRAAG